MVAPSPENVTFSAFEAKARTGQQLMRNNVPKPPHRGRFARQIVGGASSKAPNMAPASKREQEIPNDNTNYSQKRSPPTRGRQFEWAINFRNKHRGLIIPKKTW